MARHLCLTRDCLGLETRIECAIRPLAGERGLWTLLCVAGMARSQPSAIKAQGPFPGPLAAEAVLLAIAENLRALGYAESLEPPIWRLHMQAQLRRLNAERAPHRGDYQFRPDT
ncbi:MAG: hypothetical protein V4812_16555 [Pseudomonadota bacterium]